MLVVATPNPDSVAETFVRQHIRLVLPGETGVVYFQGEGDSVADVPNLKLDSETQRSKVRSMLNLLVHGYAGVVQGEQAARLIEFFRKHRVRCVLAEFGQTACALTPACRRAGVPLHVFFHGQDAGSGGRSWRIRHAFRRMSRYASGVYVNTNYFAGIVRRAGVPGEKIQVAPCGLELEQFQAAADRDRNLVLAVGRMVEKKARQLTVQAFAKVVRAVPDARLEMIGDGPLLDHARNTAETLGIGGQVIFHGARGHDFVKEQMAKAGIFVQHSVTAANGDTESLGLSLLEAMACEVPVVATRHNGFVETVEEGVTGYLVDERDVDGMADRIVELLRDPDRGKAMGAAGRQRVLARYEANRQATELRTLLGLGKPDGNPA
jgi:glycosyltransferase involved in cell wall biosynthesis